MYLSKLILNLRNKDARRDLVYPYEMHSTLKRLLPDTFFLWRAEINHDKAEAFVLLQTEDIVDWNDILHSFTIKDYLLMIPEQREIDIDSITTGQLFKFRLKANVTVTRFDPKTKKNKRQVLYNQSEHIDWFMKQGERTGFQPWDITVTNTEYLQMENRKSYAPLKLLAIQFDGRLKVLNKKLFREEALLKGIGHAKAFGLGLLSIGTVKDINASQNI